MSLNIKNERVHEMAREAARLTGKTQTSVIEEALRAYLDDLGKADRMREVRQLLAEIHAQVTPEMRDGFSAEDLYDEDGLPA